MKVTTTELPTTGPLGLLVAVTPAGSPDCTATTTVPVKLVRAMPIVVATPLPPACTLIALGVAVREIEAAGAGGHGQRERPR